MAHGDPQRKIEIMRDKRIGTGGLALLLTVSLVTVTSIASLPAIYILPAIFVSEVAAKLSLVSCATFSQPLPDGTGQYFIHNMDREASHRIRGFDHYLRLFRFQLYDRQQ